MEWMIRISFDSMGRPFMVNGTNGCGCYHFFAPKKDRIEEVIARLCALDPFVPQWLLEIVSSMYLGIRINSGWHQIERLCPPAPLSDALTYKLVPYDRLKSIPEGTGLRESMLDAKGIARRSHRIEPYILFSSGIPSIGSMRQRGYYAIELTDRVHCDDPYLFDENLFSINMRQVCFFSLIVFFTPTGIAHTGTVAPKPVSSHVLAVAQKIQSSFANVGNYTCEVENIYYTRDLIDDVYRFMFYYRKGGRKTRWLQTLGYTESMRQR